VAAISQLGAQHRRTLSQINPLFWRLHAEADGRWELFLRYMMTLKDREVLVAETAGAIHGYVIPQPISPLLVPPGHDIARIGVIDDYFDLDFAAVEALQEGGTLAKALTASAEAFFAARDLTAALTVCPAEWSSKRRLLEQAGYRTAKLWLFKPAP
jgi:hypothetical protein